MYHRLISLLTDRRNEGYRILALAILASFFWHVFWLSTITIVARPDDARRVKFSKVSFLGPLLGKGSMEVQARPRERSFLEKRYLDAAGRLPWRSERIAGSPENRYDGSYAAGNMRDDRITAAIDNALSGERPGLAYSEE